MAHLYTNLEPLSQYWDKRSASTREEWQEKIARCTAVYVGNLAFHSTEEQILEIFSKVGQVKKIVMGLNSKAKNPCGFCFIQFFTHDEAERSVRLLNSSIFDGRVIRVDWDSGEGLDNDRKYGRGPRGYQWRDEFRLHYDSGRGGVGKGNEPFQLPQNSRKRQRDFTDSSEPLRGWQKPRIHGFRNDGKVKQFPGYGDARQYLGTNPPPPSTHGGEINSFGPGKQFRSRRKGRR
ncbi:Rna recognition motif-containing protein [Cardiosporidium cionae]|uniref:Nuclear cap-binding protein subunit 2 n=1 Tax=Cardiosporidium cionae TaxID=476202 RepID=A0ABQ7JEH6_9APIC|nr:Rna recognition motif-containing protein [Cardiosporidium cionae]|eukprot:KAF8822364.1 Rna recognition motif-containing protein [Cardiosporidium cionae]